MNVNIVITREVKESKKFIEKCQNKRYRYRFLICPVIKITGPGSWEKCDRIIKRLNDFDAIIFTSKNGINYFLKRLDKKASINYLLNKKIYVVGKATGQILERQDIQVQALPSYFNSEELSKNIIRNKQNIKRVLIVKGDLSTNDLIKNLMWEGIDVKEVIVYRNKKVILSNKKIERLRIFLAKKDAMKIIVFFSPSAVINFFEQVKWVLDLQSIYYGVIGKTTEKELKEYGRLADIIPSNAELNCFCKAIEEFIETKLMK